MLRFLAMLAAAFGLTGCEIVSVTPLLEASTARAISPGFTQRVDSVDAEGDFAVIAAQEDGRTVMAKSYETDASGTSVLEPPSFFIRFHPIVDQPRFLVAEILLMDEADESEMSDDRGYGLVTCDQDDILVLLDIDIPQDQLWSASDDRFLDDWGTLTVSSAEVLFGVLNTVLDGNHYAPIEVDEIEDTVSCTDLFADPI